MKEGNNGGMYETFRRIKMVVFFFFNREETLSSSSPFDGCALPYCGFFSL